MSNSDDPIAALLSAAGIPPDPGMREVLGGRKDIFELTAASWEGSLRPLDPGGLSHDERSALAARIANLNGDGAMASHFMRMLQDDGFLATVADPAFTGGEDERLTALLCHTDLVASRTKDASRGDIEALRDAGIGDDDIVRLSELIAFVSYLLRVIAGLRLLGSSR